MNIRTETETVLAWHFAPGNGRLAYSNEPIPADGETLKVDPNRIRPCRYGLHASTRPIDALEYVQTGGIIACRVELGGRILDHGDPIDKLCASERTILWRLSPEDTDAVLRRFARWAALQVIRLWDAPQVAREYLETGNEDLRDAAYDAARGDASAAAFSAAAMDATRYAAYAAYTATRYVAYAAWRAAKNAAWAAAWAARPATNATTRDEQNTELERLFNEAHDRERNK